YDSLNRLTNRISTNGYQITFSYSPTGQRTNMTDPSGSTSYLYDTRDRLTNKVVSWSGGPMVPLNYAYDAAGNLTNLASSTAVGTLVSYQYDTLNRLTNVIDARLTGNQATSYTFDPAGNLQSYAYPNGVTNLHR